jgi:hypothetical protein
MRKKYSIKRPTTSEEPSAQQMEFAPVTSSRLITFSRARESYFRLSLEKLPPYKGSRSGSPVSEHCTHLWFLSRFACLVALSEHMLGG